MSYIRSFGTPPKLLRIEIVFELWHIESRNVVDFFDTAQEAEEAILVAAREHGSAILDGIALICVDDHDNSGMIAEGREIPDALKRIRSCEPPVTVPLRSERNHA